MINSITKAFVGVAIMQLVEEGKVELDAPVSRYIDSLPETWREARIRQLLSHTSGLPDVFDDFEQMGSDSGAARAWRRVLTRPMDFAPGSKFAYNQTNYVLLGKIIERLAGVPFATFIVDRQLRVVGMPITERAGFTDTRAIIPHAARVYSGLEGAPLANVVELHPMWLRTALGMASTADEMAKWLVALQQGKLLKNQGSLATLWTPARLPDGSTEGFSKLVNGYALGFPVVVRRAHPAIAALGGARSAFFVYPEDDLIVIVLTNLQGAFPETMIDGVAQYFFAAGGR
jgi:CubicO group peptidase (beta-lactamase class C family)